MNQKKHSNPDLIHSDRLEYPVARLLGDGRCRQLRRPFATRVGRTVRVLMPGLVINGGSVPRAAWWFQPPFTGCGVTGFWNHDADYDAHGVFRLIADFHLLVMHKWYGMRRVQRLIIFLAVLFGGHSAYKRGSGGNKYILYFDIAQEDEIRLALMRGEVVSRLMAEQDRSAAQHTRKFLQNEIDEVLAGGIDEFLKKEERE